MVRNVTEKGGPGKICSYLEDNIYVTKRLKREDSPVFQLEPKNGKGRTRILHRNILLLCDFLPVTTHENKTNFDKNKEKPLTQEEQTKCKTGTTG